MRLRQGAVQRLHMTLHVVDERLALSYPASPRTMPATASMASSLALGKRAFLDSSTNPHTQAPLRPQTSAQRDRCWQLDLAGGDNTSVTVTVAWLPSLSSRAGHDIKHAGVHPDHLEAGSCSRPAQTWEGSFEQVRREQVQVPSPEP